MPASNVASGKKPRARLWLLRHGALAPNPERRFVGQLDLPLSPKGRAQAAAWRQRLQHITFAAVICSDLQRCVDTARLIAGPHALLQPTAALREISLGQWQGLTKAEVEARFPGGLAARGQDMAHYRPQGGESFSDVAARVLPCINALAQKHAHQDLLVVAHAGVNRVVLAHALALPLPYLLDIPQPYACCTLLHS